MLSVVLGVFVVCMGSDKLGWLSDSSLLASELRGWREFAPEVSRWYLDMVAIPGAPVFARLVVMGELVSGAALIAGYRVRVAALLALLMVLNFHFAMGLIFQSAYLTNGYALPVVGGLAALAIGGRRLPLGLDTWLAARR